MMRSPLRYLAATVLLLVLGGCKKTDDTPPSISMLSPADNRSFVATSEIPIQISASDEGGLSSVSMQLASADFGAVVASGSQSLTGTADTRSFALTCGDRYTAAGTYTLSLIAFDKAGNTSKAETQIQVTELPLQFYRAVFTVYPPLVGVYQLFSIDSAGLSDAGPYLGDSVAALLVENRHQRVAVALRDDGSVRGYHPDDFEADFNYQANPPHRSLNCLRSAGQEGYLVGYETPPYLRQLDRGGQWRNDWDAVLYPVRNALYDQTRVFLSVHGLFGQPIKLDYYNYPAQNLTGARPFSADLLYLARHEDALIAAGPSGNATKVFRLALPSLVIQDSATINSPLIGADGAGERHFVLTEAGVARLDLPNFGLNTGFLPGSFTCIGFDPSRQQLWMGGNGQIEVYSINGGLVTTHTTAYGEVRHMGFHLNK